MSKFPIAGLSANGNRVIEKTKVDNALFIDNLDSLGPNWGEAFVSPMSCIFTDGSEKYKLLHSYFWKGSSSNFVYPGQHAIGVASTGTDLYLCGSSSVRPSKYNIATNSWNEGSMAYNDYGTTDLSVGAFGYDGDAYFYTNNPGMETAVNFLEIKKYDPGTNTWTTLTPLSSKNLATVIYGFMGVANGSAYFMQMIKSSNATYVPAGFPTVYRYQFATDTWVNVSVIPPLIKNGGAAAYWADVVSLYSHLRANNTVSCKMSNTEFLIHVRGFLGVTGSYAPSGWPFFNSHDIYKFDVQTNAFSFVCHIKHDVSPHRHLDYVGNYVGKIAYLDARIFYQNGYIYLWYPWQKGLIAYSVESHKQYFVPINSINSSLPIVCEEGGKIFMFSGYRSAYPYSSTLIQDIDLNGSIIDLNAISDFLNKEKTLAVNVKSFD